MFEVPRLVYVDEIEAIMIKNNLRHIPADHLTSRTVYIFHVNDVYNNFDPAYKENASRYANETK